MCLHGSVFLLPIIRRWGQICQHYSAIETPHRNITALDVGCALDSHLASEHTSLGLVDKMHSYAVDIRHQPLRLCSCCITLVTAYK